MTLRKRTARRSLPILNRPKNNAHNTAASASLSGAERALLILEHTTDLISLLTEDGYFVYVSESHRQLGYQTADLLGTHALELVYPADQPMAREYFQRIFSAGTAQVSLRMRHAAGDWSWFEIRGTAIDRNSGRYVVGVARDITERKRNEETQRFLAEASTALARSLAYPATLQRVAELAVPFLADWCFVDLLEEDGSFQRVAIAHADPRKADLAQRLKRTYRPIPHASVGVSLVMRTGQPELLPLVPDGVLEMVARDAEHLALLRALQIQSCLCVPLVAGDRLLGTITLLTAESGRHYQETDIPLAQELAHRCALAIDNARLYAEAQDAIRVRDTFLSIATHELKAPLTAVSGFAQLLDRRTNETEAAPERDQRAVQVIIEQTERMTSLVNTLLDLSRLQTGQLQVTRALMDVRAMVVRVVETLLPTLVKHTIQFDSTGTPTIIYGDEMRLQQVLQNLIGNAIKYSPTGGAIRVGLAVCGDQVCITVADSGIGIPEAAQARLFQRFYRAPNAAKQQIGGMGIGLYVVKEIVSLHGGTITVQSREGEGSTFTLRLPLGESAASR